MGVGRDNRICNSLVWAGDRVGREIRYIEDLKTDYPPDTLVFFPEDH